ncbi:MAG: hypothetical protein JSR37_06580 [Verrucomicrobia bacterium]|nr:hypothetical protein [Verrucomicrobiota bacterium]MBS0636475.1 hypothetical protein [Verrucomicrobiota bacterium]
MNACETAVQVKFWGIPIAYGATDERSVAIYNLDRHPLSVTLKGVVIGMVAKVAFNYASTVPSWQPITNAIVLGVESLPYVSDACKVIGTENVITTALCAAGATYKLAQDFVTPHPFYNRSLFANLKILVFGY